MIRVSELFVTLFLLDRRSFRSDGNQKVLWCCARVTSMLHGRNTDIVEIPV